MHQPPTNRSFYLSLAASTLRFAIIVALVDRGHRRDRSGLPRALGDGGDGGGGGGTTTADRRLHRRYRRQRHHRTDRRDGDGWDRPSRARRSSASGSRCSTAPGSSGLAGDTQTAAGGARLYREPGRRPTHRRRTRSRPSTTPPPRTRSRRTFLASSFFKKLDAVEVVRLEPDTGDIDPSTQVAIFLGNDYAALKSN